MVSKSTKQILVQVKVTFLPSQSNVKVNEYAFAYQIIITNHSPNTVQLLHRKWVITDSNFEMREVLGEGVVGRQPVLEPNDTFQYQSGVYTKTEIAKMEGSYTFHNMNSNEEFAVDIPCFDLVAWYKLN